MIFHYTCIHRLQCRASISWVAHSIFKQNHLYCSCGRKLSQFIAVAEVAAVGTAVIALVSTLTRSNPKRATAVIWRMNLPGIFCCLHRCSPSWSCASREPWTCFGPRSAGPCTGPSPPAVWASWQTGAWEGCWKTRHIAVYLGTVQVRQKSGTATTRHTTQRCCTSHSRHMQECF